MTQFIKFIKTKTTLIFVTVIIAYFAYFILFIGDGSCIEYKNFYRSNVKNKVLSIERIDVGKGINIFYYFDINKKLYFYQNTLSFYHDFEGLQVGDSIVKEANETNFDIYKNGVFYKRAELGCICNYCR